MNPTWNTEELPEQGKESINVRIYKKGDKTGFSTYRGISLLLSTYKNCVLHPALLLFQLDTLLFLFIHL